MTLLSMVVHCVINDSDIMGKVTYFARREKRNFPFGGGGILLLASDDREILNPSISHFTSHWLISQLRVEYFLCLCMSSIVSSLSSLRR